MRSGYKLKWSDRALADLKNIIEYLTENWTQRGEKTLQGNSIATQHNFN